MLRQWTVDAFAAAPFRGNPACVVEPFEAWPAEAWMQSLAAENNQAETAFLRRTQNPEAFELRWFTPAVEVPICGHATLAAGHVLFAELGLACDQVAFETRSGELRVRRTEAGYEMDFPGDLPAPVEVPQGLATALGVEPVAVFLASYMVVLVEDEAAVRRVRPDLGFLAAVETASAAGRGNVGVAALAAPDAPYDVVSRFFAPGSGIPEDPTTGSWHCLLAPLFARRLGRRRLRFHQAYPGRGGDLECEVTGDRVLLRGAARTVIDAQLRIMP